MDCASLFHLVMIWFVSGQVIHVLGTFLYLFIHNSKNINHCTLFKDPMRQLICTMRNNIYDSQPYINCNGCYNLSPNLIFMKILLFPS